MVRIQLRRDTSENWSTSNPTLRQGEIGIETDTLKFKIGDGTNAWNSITSYANVVPGDLNTTLQEYVLVTDIGDTVAGLDGNQNLLIPNDSIIFEGATADSFELTLVATDPTADRTLTLPDVNGTIVTTGDTGTVTNTMLAGSIANNKLSNSSITLNGFTINLGGNQTIQTKDITENTNLYFTDERAQDAVAAALAAGTHTNISVSYDDNTNSISLTGAVTYTDENAQDAVGNAVGNGLDYDDATGSISVDPSEFALNAVGSPTGDLSLATYKITNLGTPTQSTDATTKAYVDATAEGLLTKPAVDVATTANISATYNNGAVGVGATLTIAATETLDIDGKTSWSQYDAVLIKNQTNSFENGRYVLTTVGNAGTAWVFTRCGLCDEADEIPGAYMFVLDGTLNGQTSWVLHVDNPTTFVVGTDDIDAYQFSGAGTYLAGTGLTLTANTFSINTNTTVDLNTSQTLTNKSISATSNTITGVINNTLVTNIGDIIYASAENTPNRLGIGAEGQLLTVVSGIPNWQNPPITLPEQQGNAGKYLTTDGTNAAWTDIAPHPFAMMG